MLISFLHDDLFARGSRLSPSPTYLDSFRPENVRFVGVSLQNTLRVIVQIFAFVYWLTYAMNLLLAEVTGGK